MFCRCRKRKMEISKSVCDEFSSFTGPPYIDSWEISPDMTSKTPTEIQRTQTMSVSECV